jgi:hypothetical protein
MAQHNDLIIDDQTGSDFLPDLNSLFTAILTQNSGNDEPPVKVPFMFWAEPDSDTLWQRNAANDGWVDKGKLSAGLGGLAFLSTVGTDQIAGGAITSEKIASGTAGKYLGFDGSGDPAELDPPSGGVFTESYDSGDQTITSGGSLTLAHGLSSKPKLYKSFLKCATAEYGYSVGDEIEVAHLQEGGSTSANRAVVLVPDATNVFARIGSDGLIVVHKSTGNRQNMTNANWRLIVRAWA